MTIELITFDGCPHAAEARANALQAIESAGVQIQLREWDRDSAAAPTYVKRYPSPTVLVDGRDVTGLAGPSDAQPAGACCAAGGAPSVDIILAALRA